MVKKKAGLSIINNNLKITRTSCSKKYSLSRASFSEVRKTGIEWGNFKSSLIKT
jgi:hypothetical protein